LHKKPLLKKVLTETMLISISMSMSMSN
jgi:hypothetical protein